MLKHVLRVGGPACLAVLIASAAGSPVLAAITLRESVDLVHSLTSSPNSAVGAALPAAPDLSDRAGEMQARQTLTSSGASGTPGVTASRFATPVRGTPTSPRQAGAPLSALSLGWGVVEPDWPGSAAGLNAVESAVGRHANLLETYVHWGGGWRAFQDVAPGLQAALARGSTPVITWMSDDPAGGDQSRFDARAIAAGAWDGYAQSWAAGLRSLGGGVMLRFDSEINGNWMPYSPGVGGNATTAADFVAAWRHLHDIFTAAGAANVAWVWSPNIEYQGSAPLAPLYPGDAYVDWVALDGYNWGTTNGHVWESFAETFDPSLAAVAALTSRPLMLAEVGSTEVGGSKSGWITDMFTQLSARPQVRGFVWFDATKETDWRIASSPDALAAFAAGVARIALPS